MKTLFIMALTFAISPLASAQTTSEILVAYSSAPQSPLSPQAPSPGITPLPEVTAQPGSSTPGRIRYQAPRSNMESPSSKMMSDETRSNQDYSQEQNRNLNPQSSGTQNLLNTNEEMNSSERSNSSPDELVR